YFASPQYPAATLAKEMSQAFVGIEQMGCTTSGEISTGRMSDGSLVAMAFGADTLDETHVAVLSGLKEGVELGPVFDTWEKKLGQAMNQLSPDEYLGLVLIDGLSGMEEEVNERITDRTDVVFVGASSGDDLKFEQTAIFVNGEAMQDAAVLALWKPKVPFQLLKTQSFEITDQVMVPTRVEEEKRLVHEFNGMPATQAYAQALGVTEEQLGDYLFKNPLGLIYNKNEPFVRSPRVIDGTSIYFYCGIKEGIELKLLRSGDIVNDTRAALNQAADDMQGIEGIINFNCILRTLDLKQSNRTEEYAKLFSKVPTIGFSTYGESFIGHINQTATMVLLGK
ncbi:MAG: hypothetical protein HC842_08215, partial [Cytophagales bacterium]|nr:hypothetical protein [Cytophagales bacterium]